MSKSASSSTSASGTKGLNLSLDTWAVLLALLLALAVRFEIFKKIPW